MLLATVLLLCPFPQAVDVAKSVTETPAIVSADAANDSSNPKSLPSTPEPKVKTDADAANSSSSASGVTPSPTAAVTPGNPSPAIKPGKSAFTRGYETEKQKKEWYALVIASSGAAVFDAWSTRRAVSGGWGTESNPLLRPFSHSNAMYAATQVSPLVLDFIGRKMMTSRHQMLRRLWWLPQSMGMTTSVMAGINNVTVVH
ncbi:MAG TPA: hypothetical protein VE077_04955 [Candidatus Methylomirabilis sp.]|nr:hypothetical protein [Candidatus Methylomirabilis sp.]